VFSVSAIVAGLWPEQPPAGAEKTVQAYVSRLRRTLPRDGSSLVCTRSPGYLAAVDATQVDAERFRALAAAGRRDLSAGRAATAAAELRDALAMWRGEAYAEFDAPFAIAERTALEELRLAAVEDRIAADLAMGAGPELVGELGALVRRHPWRERLWGQLMTALYRSGRQADALGAFQRARAALVDELGVEPGPDLRAVEARVLAQDARLLGGITESARSAFPAGPMFVGRDAELSRLLDAYDRTAAGAVGRILLTGPHGIGKSRLLAEFARDAAARGALVRYGSGEAWPQQAGALVVIVLDDLQRVSTEELAQLAERVVGSRPPLLVVGACIWDALSAGQNAALSRTFRDRLSVPPLQAADVTVIVRLYVPEEAVEDGVAAVADAGGVPLQVHAAASRYGERLAEAQIEQAAAGIAGPRRHLTASQERVAGGVLDLQRVRLARAAHEPVETPVVLCPYKGLAFYDVDDAPYFFGRERQVAQLVARLVDARTLTVIGASGSGKSSVVRAGLVAALRAGMLPGSERWRIVVTTPTQPRPERTAAGTRTLLVVDQFEELVTALSPMLQEEYADWLADAAAEDEMTVVVAVRSDYYAQAAAHPRLSDLLAGNTVLVGEMASDELRQAVEQPATAAGLELEPGLAETVAGDVSGEPGGLPLMSTALLSLWERRDGRQLSLATYREMGGVRTAVARLAETAYGQLTPSQQSVARRTLLRLADTGEGGEPVRRRVPIAEVAPDGDAAARAVLGALAARRLLTVSETHAEVAHEAVLREWPRLRAWLDEDEAGRQLRRHLAPAARDWQAAGRDAGELYRGPRLAAALDWQRDHRDDLTELEQDFLRTSREAVEAEAVRRRRSIRRLRGLAVGLAGVLLLALVAGLVAIDQRNDATQSSLEADVRALQANALNEDRWDRALLYAAQAQRFEPSADSRAALLQTVQRAPEATAIFTADQSLDMLATSSDGTKLAATGAGGTLYVWDTGTGQLVNTIQDTFRFPAVSVDISPDNRYVAAVGVTVPRAEEINLDFRVVVVDLQQTPPAVHYLEEEQTFAARFAADSRTIVTVGEGGRIRYLDVATGNVKRILDFGHPGWEERAVGLDVSENRKFMVASDLYHTPGPVTAWEVDTGRQVWTAAEPEPTVASISPDGSKLVIGHADSRIEHVDLAAGGTRTQVPSFLDDKLIDLAWSPDGKTFAGSTMERTVLVWDAATLATKTVLRGHWGSLSQMAYSPDGGTLYAAGADRSVLAWDLTGTKGIVTEIGARPAPGTQVQQVALALDGSVAATSYSDGRVEVFDVASGEAFGEIFQPGPPGYENWMYFDQHGRYVLVHVYSESRRGPTWGRMTVHLIDVQRRQLLPYTIELESQSGSDAVVTPDGEAVLASADRQVSLRDLATGRQLSAQLFEAADVIGGISVHPDGRLAALSETGGLIEVIDVTTGELVHTVALGDLALGGFAAGPVMFSPDGRWFAAGAWFGRVVVWDTQSWKMHSMWDAGPGFGIDSLVFTPDSQFLISGAASTASMWIVEQGASGGVKLDVDPLRPEAAVSVGTRDDGRTLVTFTEGTGVRTWTVEPQRLLEHACAVAGRNLTQQEWADVLPNRPYERTCREYPTG
jgi:WD40 repeat protein/DNA-binding SARP family transcriptional activator